MKSDSRKEYRVVRDASSGYTIEHRRLDGPDEWQLSEERRLALWDVPTAAVFAMSYDTRDEAIKRVHELLKKDATTEYNKSSCGLVEYGPVSLRGHRLYDIRRAGLWRWDVLYYRSANRKWERMTCFKTRWGARKYVAWAEEYNSL